MNSSDNYQLFIKEFLYFCDMRKLIFSLLVSVAAYAAAETPDIPAASPDSTAATAPEPVLPGLPAAIIYGTEYVPSCLLSDDEVARRFAFDAPSYSPLITSWRSGAVWAEGGSASLPGMAGVESGTINATQRIGNIYVSAYAGATKYGYFRGLSTQWQFGGTLHWQFAPRLGITLFGSYSTSAWQPGMSPGIAEMISRPEFGGYLSWDITKRFGVDVGARARYDNMNRWQWAPIVAPYYRVGDAKISVDVGGIVYEALRSKAKWGPRNPTMGIPRPEIPIAPRD